MVKNYLTLQLRNTAFYPLLFLIGIWTVFAIQYFGEYNLTWLGILPRKLKGIHGIFTSIFVHGDVEHIASNSLPLLVLGMLLFYFYKRLARQVFVWIWLVSGLWLWIGGRSSDLHETRHIGASTLIYGFATFLFFSGVFRKHKPLMVVSALVVFMYGSIMWGIFPLKAEMSWEGHLFGAIAGLLVAYNYRAEGPQRRVYDWENEEDDEDDEEHHAGEDDNDPPPGLGRDNSTDPFPFTYTYKKNP
jgi:membrane associated rhomboid family serine protease